MFTQFLQTVALIVLGFALIVAGTWVAVGAFAAGSMFNQIKERLANLATVVLGIVSLGAIVFGLYLIKIS